MVESDSEHSTKDESSLPSSSLVSKTLSKRRRLLIMKDDTSFTSEDYLFEDETTSIASTLATPPILIELFHQSLDINSSRSFLTFLIASDVRKNADNPTPTSTTIITDPTRERGIILQFTPRLPEQ